MAESKEEEKTLQFQDELPSLPLPSLEHTIELYLKSCEPLLTAQELEHTTAVCADFMNGAGPKLQEILADKAENERNWIEEWWETFAYLRPRYPSAVNVNWFGVLPGKWGPRDMSQAQAAAIIIVATLHFRKDFHAGTFPVQKLMGRPLCMYQYTRAFNSCVIPGEECDEIETYPEDAKHIVVLRNNAIWSVQVLDDNGETLPLKDILAQIVAIREEATGLFDLERFPPVSVLTAEKRTEWAKAREYMMELDSTNKESLETIQKALFCVALDEKSPATDEEIAQNALLGDGRNRWYDKPFTAIVYENARIGLNGEHAWADAIAVVYMYDHCIKYVNDHFKSQFSEENRKNNEVTKDSMKYLSKRLHWKIDNSILTAIECASATVSKLIHASDLTTLQFHHYGDAFLKRYKLTPDFFSQMAIQLAYYKMYKHNPAVYESVHTRFFYHGRTETIRSLSNDSKSFCEIMESNAEDGVKWDALKKAISTHKECLKECILGQGIDRHLMGLYIASEMSGISPRPAIFTDKAFDLSKKFIISSSNISGGRDSSPIWGGFSAVEEDGYGVCYAFQPDRINYSISSYHTSSKTDSTKFKRSLETALLEMRELCLTRNVIYLGKSNI